MNAILILACCLFIASVSRSQADSRIMLRGNLVDLNSRYSYNDYSRDFSRVSSASLLYMRSVTRSGDLFIGGGLGFRNIKLNEPGMGTNIDQATSASFILPGAFLRNEFSFGRSSKMVLELGASVNVGVSSKTVDYYAREVSSYQTVNTGAYRVFIGYCLDWKNKWKFEVGITECYDFKPSLSFEERKLKVRETALTIGMLYKL